VPRRDLPLRDWLFGSTSRRLVLDELAGRQPASPKALMETTRLGSAAVHDVLRGLRQLDLVERPDGAYRLYAGGGAREDALRRLDRGETSGQVAADHLRGVLTALARLDEQHAQPAASPSTRRSGEPETLPEVQRALHAGRRRLSALQERVERLERLEATLRGDGAES